MARRHVQQTSALIELLCASGLEFAIVGGVAAVMHGSARMTLDLDVIMDFSVPNLERLLEALRPHDPRHAGRRKDIEVVHELEAIRERLESEA